MFTPKNIQGALEELYDLCDPDYMVDMLVNYSEEFDDISPALLAKSFQKNAEMISEYRVLSSAGEGIDYQGKVLLNSRAVRLLSYVEDMSGDEKVRTIQSKELWLAEDMTFYVVSCMSTITICASREDLLQSMYWLFLMKGGGDIYDCETEYARSRMEQKLGVITVEEFLEKILVN